MNYARHYKLLIEKHGSISKPSTYAERHHIVPKCLGGSDEESNLIYLSAEAYYVAHQLLVKMNPGHHGLSYAAMLMTRVGRGTERVNNKHYSWLKISYAKTLSAKSKELMYNMWSDPKFREHQLVRLKEMINESEFKEDQKLSASKTLTSLRKDKEFNSKYVESLRNSLAHNKASRLNQTKCADSVRGCKRMTTPDGKRKYVKDVEYYTNLGWVKGWKPVSRA